MTQRRSHNPNGVDSGASLMRSVIEARYGALIERIKEKRAQWDAYALAMHGVSCKDCGMWLGLDAKPGAICPDCQCIRDTGEQCIYPDMEQFTVGG